MAEVIFDPILEGQLERVATITGQSIHRVVQEAVKNHCQAVLQQTETLDVALADYIGCLDSSGQSDASRMSEGFGEIVAEKRGTNNL